MNSTPIQRKPDWLRIRLPSIDEYTYIKSYLNQFHLHTICESGNCPNQAECWKAKTATFMILGDQCSRTCRFCNVKKGNPCGTDPNEPESVANVVELMKLKHCVITSVTRDDLNDGGSGIWAETVQAIRKKNPSPSIETLIPDFNGNRDNLQHVIDAAPQIISHNLETVRRLTPTIRVQAKYDVSLNVIKMISDSGIRSKSGIMLGLGESDDDILETMDDLLAAGCEVFTLGQYLQPTRKNIPVVEYVEPEKFEKYKTIALSKGFKVVESGPLVRSSYNSHKHLR